MTSCTTRQKTRRLLPWLLLTSAIVLLVQGGWIHAKAWLAQQLLERAWQQTQADGQAHKPWPWADHWPIARLRVPAQQQNLIVLEGDSGAVLAFAPGHTPQSGLPQGPNAHPTAVISAHRDTHFAFLQTLQRGQLLLLDTTHGHYRYRIQQTQIVNSDHQGIRIQPDDNQLILSTCWPFHAITPGPQRYLIRAKRLI